MAVKYISIILGAVFEIYCINKFIKIFSSKKDIANYKFQLIYSAIGLAHIIFSIFINGIPLAICSFTTVFLFNQLYNSKQYVKMIIAISISVMNISSELLFGGIFMLVFNGTHLTVNTSPEAYAVGILLSKFFVFLVILIIESKKFSINTSSLTTKYLILLSVLPITTIILSALMYQIILLINSLGVKITFVFANVLLILSNVVTFEIIRNQNRLAKSEYELKLLKGNLSEQTKHYEQLRSSHDEIRKLRHDMKNTYLGVIASLEANNTAAAVEQLKSDLNIIYTSGSVIDTGHPAIDAVIENKLKRCKELNIYTNLIYNYTAEIRVNEIEIAVIIGNILDNAIEGCLRSKQTNGIIYGAISSDEENIIVDIRNTANDSNNFKTLKRNKKAHGFGLKSVSHIAKKHNGYAKYTFENNEFSTFVMMEN